MGEDAGQAGATVEGGQRDPEEIRRDIEATRRELGDTAAALAAKTDVKARAKDKVDDVKQTISEKKESLTSGDGADSQGGSTIGSAATNVTDTARANPIPAAAIAAFAVGFLIGRLTRRGD